MIWSENKLSPNVAPAPANFSSKLLNIIIKLLNPFRLALDRFEIVESGTNNPTNKLFKHMPRKANIIISNTIIIII